MPKESYITASEIGTYCFCIRAWHLGKVGVPSGSARARKVGTEWHEEYSRRVATATRSHQMARAFGLAFLALVLLLSLTWVLRP